MTYLLAFGLVVLLAVIVISAVVAAIGTAGRGAISAVQPAQGSSYTAVETLVLVIVGCVGAVAALLVGSIHRDGWWLLPVGVFITVLIAVKTMAARRHAREVEAERQRLERETQRIEQRKRLEGERLKKLGKDGVQTLANMQMLVEQIAATAAAREGWLGDADGIDFAADIQLTEAQLTKLVTLRAAIKEYKRLPDPSDDDKAMTKQAEQAVKKLEGGVRDRVRAVEGCARKAAEIDAELREQRRRAAVAEKRDELRGTLGAMLSGIELSPDSPPSESVDRITARAEAFRELKDSIEPRNLGPDGIPLRPETAPSKNGLGRLWPW